MYKRTEILKNYEKLKNWHECDFKRRVLTNGNIDNIIKNDDLVVYYHIKVRRLKHYIISIPKTGSTSLLWSIRKKSNDWFSVCRTHADLISHGWYEKLGIRVPEPRGQYNEDCILLETLIMIEIFDKIKIYTTYRKPLQQSISFYYYFQQEYCLPAFGDNMSRLKYIITLEYKWKFFNDLMIFLFNSDNLEYISNQYNVKILHMSHNEVFANKNQDDNYEEFKCWVYKKFNLEKLNNYMLSKNKYMKIYSKQFEKIIGGE